MYKIHKSMIAIIFFCAFCGNFLFFSYDLKNPR